MRRPALREPDVAFSIPDESDLRDRTGDGWVYDPNEDAWHTRRLHFHARFAGVVSEPGWARPVREVSITIPGASITQTYSEEVTVECADAASALREVIEATETIDRIGGALGGGVTTPLARLDAKVSTELSKRVESHFRAQETRTVTVSDKVMRTWSETVTVPAVQDGARVFVMPVFERVAYDVHLEFLDHLTVTYGYPSPLALRRRKVKEPAGPTTASGHWTRTNPNVRWVHIGLWRVEVWRPLARSLAIASEGDNRIGSVDPLEIRVGPLAGTVPTKPCPTEDVRSLYDITEGGGWPTRLTSSHETR